MRHNRGDSYFTYQLQSVDKEYNKKKSKFRNQIKLQNLGLSTLESVLSVLRGYDVKVENRKKALKVFNLFYIDPLSTKTGIWDFFIIITIYLFQLQISLTLGFGPEFWNDQLDSKAYLIIYITLILIIAVDVVINFHKGYYAFGRGKVIDDPALIIKHYLKIYFAMDIATISLLIVPLISSDYFLNFLQMVPAVLLYIKKFKNQNQIIGMLQYQKKFRIFFILFMLGCDVMLIGHFGACIFVGIDLLLWRIQYYGNDPQYYWLSNNSMYEPNLIDGWWILQYVYAQSFSTGTLSTIAPGPFGKNPIQVLYSNFVMIFFMILASYVAQVLVSILLSEDEIRTFHEDNIQKFDNFMKLKGVSEKINGRVHNFFQLIWEAEIKMNVEDEKEVLEKLPVSLQQELLIQMGFVKNLTLIRFFSKHYLIEKLMSMKISSMIIDSDTTLFKAGTPPADIEQRYLYHFKDGLAKFFIQKGEQQYTLALSNVQRNVGQFQFVTGLAYSYSCKSVDLCIVSRVANADLLETISQNGMREEYQTLKYKLLIQNQLQLISKVCIVCEGKHTEDKCPEINPSIYIQKRAKNDFRKQKAQRSQYKRKKFKTKKQRFIQPRAIAKAHIVLLFLSYKGLSGMILDITKNQSDRLDKVKDYQKFYPKFNIQSDI